MEHGMEWNGTEWNGTEWNAKRNIDCVPSRIDEKLMHNKKLVLYVHTWCTYNLG